MKIAKFFSNSGNLCYRTSLIRVQARNFCLDSADNYGRGLAMAFGCNQRMEGPTQGGAVGRELFLSRPPEERQAIQTEMKIINRPVCVEQNQTGCSRFDQYVEAWRRLAKASPFVGYKLLAQDEFEWPDSFSREAVKKDPPEIPQEV